MILIPGSGAVLEEQSPFQLLQLHGHAMPRIDLVAMDRFHKVHKCIGVPLPGNQPKQ